MTYVFGPPVVVPAIPPQKPPLNLIDSSVKPDGTTEPSTGSPDLTGLPSALRDELSNRSAPMWVRGFTYAPENHYAIEIRDPQDFTSVDTPAIPAPTGVQAVAASGGTLAAGTYSYQVTAVNANGETTTSATATVTTTSTGSVTITWPPVADGISYNVYGRSGTLARIAEVSGFDPENPPTFTDTGATTPSGAAPTSNTTGGVGPYSNLGTVQVQPFLLVAEDYCSTFGFEARDFKGRALRLLENAQYQAIEREFWTGALAQAKGYPNNYLTKSSSPAFVDLTPSGTPPSVARGQQILQDYIASSGFGGRGMIHCQPQTAPNLLNARRVGNQLFDMFDNIIVPGVGYPGSASNIGTPAAGTAVMFATDLVMTRVEDTGRVDLVGPNGHIYPDSFAEAVDRGEDGFPNSVRFRAEKYGVAYWDGFIQAGVRVTLAT